MGKIRFSINTLGCKVNQSESDYIAGELQKKGMLLVPHDKNPDYCLVNTCTVTSRSDRKVRQLVRRLKSENKGSKIIVTGCFVEFNKKFLRDSGVDFIVSNRGKAKIPDLILEEVLKGKNRNNFKTGFLPASKMLHSRALVKIQDGCEQNCNYCIIPKVRGGYKSTTPGEVLQKIAELQKNGFEEIVLTGINIGKYGIDFNKNVPGFVNGTSNLTDLMDKIFKSTSVRRIRISSIEVNDITTGLLDVLKRNRERFAPHLHIPLQSGSGKVLRLMARPYGAGYYLKKIKFIMNFFPGIALTTDVMVGFPGEEDNDFNCTVDFVKKVGFSKIHVFKFSGREHTPAFRMAGQVDEKVKSRRSKILRDSGNELRDRYLKASIGKTLKVICEKISDGNIVSGTSGNYIKVYLKMDEAKFLNLSGKIIEVRINSVYKNGLMGEFLQS
jgi:threonylcarbamoyladenosine tRNA methylthiotransferase MtaB